MIEHFQFLVRHLAKRLECPSRRVKRQRTVKDHPMFVGMVLSGVGPKIIELKMNKVRWECLQKLRRQLYAPCVIEKARPYPAVTTRFIQGCDSGFCKEGWHQPEAPHQKQSNREVTHRGRRLSPCNKESRLIIRFSLNPPLLSSTFLYQGQCIKKVRGHMVQKP